MDRFEVRTSTGQALSALSFLDLEKKLGVPVGMIIHRADLLRELAAGLDKAHIHCGARSETSGPRSRRNTDEPILVTSGIHEPIERALNWLGTAGVFLHWLAIP